MPFTPSHIAAVLPLRNRAGLPLAALAAGSMSPDLPYFVPGWGMLRDTHTPVGILTIDLVLGLAMWLAWRVGAAAVHELVPQWIRQRWQPAAWPATARQWVLVVVAVLIGAATHVLWDEFTHQGRFGARHIPVIAAQYATPWGALPGHAWLQYASGVLGLAVICWVGAHQPQRDTRPHRHPRLARSTPWLVVAGAATAVAAKWSATGPADARSVAFNVVTAAIGGGAAVMMLLCLGVTALRPLPARERSAPRARAAAGSTTDPD